MFAPKPAQRPHLPIWVGGEAKGARRRAGQLSDGWYPVTANPKHPLDTADRYGTALADVRAEADKVGRDGRLVTGALLAIYCKVGAEQKDKSGKRLTFTGSAQAIIADIAEYQRHGLEHFLVGGDGRDLNGTIDHIEQFASEVMPHLP